MNTGGNPLSFGQWNKGVLHYVSIWKPLRNSKNGFTPVSRLEPGRDGMCIAIMYLKSYSPTWKSLPCDKPLVRHWICKTDKRPRRILSNQFLLCCYRCLAISSFCFTYDFTLPSRHTIDFKPNALSYIERLFHILSYHDNQRNFNHRATNAYFNNSLNWSGYVPRYVKYNFIVENSTAFNDAEQNVQVYLTKETQHKPTCGMNMQTCDDGTCVIQSYICVLDFECSPMSCSCKLRGGRLLIDRLYCMKLCKTPECICSPLMFQCSSGGCISYTTVCDGESNCRDSSDELCPSVLNSYIKSRSNDYSYIPEDSVHIDNMGRCLSFKCITGLCIDYRLVNDLIPDCHEAEDEVHSLNMKSLGSVYGCIQRNEIQCVPGHSKCFEIHNLCVYDHDEFGHLTHCRDAAHLLDCKWIECTNTFKCPGSYCIPLRKVCDGREDCIGGEDETNCQKHICVGFLKCNGVEFCIHPNEVCDGYTHCPKGDDEKMCDIQHCPAECQCTGYSAFCRDANFPYTPMTLTHQMKYLSIGYHVNGIPNLSNLTMVSELIILDFSESGISSICKTFQNHLSFFDSLIVLYLQHNRISDLLEGCFGKLISLSVINLKGNHIKYIADSAFQGLTLHFLILSNTHISAIVGTWPLLIKQLDTLDLRGSFLTSIGGDARTSLSNVDEILSDDFRLCCILKNTNKRCDPDNDHGLPCKRLLFHPVIGLGIMSYSIAIVIFINLSLWLNIKHCYQKKTIQFLLNNGILMSGILCSVYVIVLSFMDEHYGAYFVLSDMFWRSSILCRSLSVFLTIGLSLSTITTVIFQQFTYLAVTKLLLDHNASQLSIKYVYFATIILLLLVYLLPSILEFIFAEPSYVGTLCIVFGNGSAHTIWSRLSSILLGLTMSSALVHTLFTSLKMYKVVYTTAREVEVLSCSLSKQHRKNLHGMFQTMMQSIIFRLLECVPIIVLIALHLHEYCGNSSFELMALVLSITVMGIWKPFSLIWSPLLHGRERPILKSLWLGLIIIVTHPNLTLFSIVNSVLFSHKFQGACRIPNRSSLV